MVAKQLFQENMKHFVLWEDPTCPLAMKDMSIYLMVL
jgi:hypothetical protein